MCRSMVDIQSPTAEIRRGIKKDRKKPQGKNIMSASASQGGHKKSAAESHYIKTVIGKVVVQSIAFRVVSKYCQGVAPFP